MRNTRMITMAVMGSIVGLAVGATVLDGGAIGLAISGAIIGCLAATSCDRSA